jgi:hypothetical protein
MPVEAVLKPARNARLVADILYFKPIGSVSGLALPALGGMADQG